MGVSAVIASWVNTSDDDAALQFLPNDGAPGNGSIHYDVPSLYVGNSTGELIRGLVANNEVDTATVVLNAPSYEVSSHTVISHLSGTAGTNDTVIVYTHSDGPSIVEENGQLSMSHFISHLTLPNRQMSRSDQSIKTGTRRRR
ncbi:hypothetical protein C8R42DRAFT_8202 [Lentinula raphanica]|nr:hypothetical protein C8R42DRAFT_8202 [Lentinula raphanica]